ncbi:MAG: PilZ domain-containing protein [Methylococcales symbiont of Iophon sp. n. MRB-2018]|nr:MAG: PilZ domain-containing protein [Methylococcales symbiont of Iophon sp. n. MRB-2018]KAF3979129.1 MAG: PilZ domain-containing protein [Methylococcales symbiont of Iophon sp. n. MRB-2018]
MQEYDKKHDYIRMDVNCEVTYKMIDSTEIKTGRCTSLSGASVSFITDCSYDAGLAMEIKILLKNSVTPITAFIEVIRSTSQKNSSFEVAATIKSLK